MSKSWPQTSCTAAAARMSPGHSIPNFIVFSCSTSSDMMKQTLQSWHNTLFRVIWQVGKRVLTMRRGSLFFGWCHHPRLLLSNASRRRRQSKQSVRSFHKRNYQPASIRCCLNLEVYRSVFISRKLWRQRTKAVSTPPTMITIRVASHHSVLWWFFLFKRNRQSRLGIHSLTLIF